VGEKPLPGRLDEGILDSHDHFSVLVEHGQLSQRLVNIRHPSAQLFETSPNVIGFDTSLCQLGESLRTNDLGN
jgi:hypothetical protein